MTANSQGMTTSRDGTRIAFTRRGTGLPLILVDGALCSRTMGPSEPLAKLLARDFTVFTYDRRGRGESGDTPPHSLEREIEDLRALIDEAGGTVYVWGISSGAMLALEAANRLTGIKKLALYEAPLVVDDSRPVFDGVWTGIDAAIAAGHRNEALRLFLKSVGMPGFFLALMRILPVWSKLKAVAHTLPYDGAILRRYQQGKPLSTGQWSSVSAQTLVMDGGKSPAWMCSGNRALAAAVPGAQYLTLAGQTHMVNAKVHAPVLTQFFKSQ